MKQPSLYWKSFAAVRKVDSGFIDFYYKMCDHDNCSRFGVKEAMSHRWLKVNGLEHEQALEEARDWVAATQKKFLKDLLSYLQTKRSPRKVGFCILYFVFGI